MSFFQVTEDDISALRIKLKEALGEGYEVEAHKEVSALMGAVGCEAWQGDRSVA